MGKKFKKSGAPAKGYKWKSPTDGRIPIDDVVPVPVKPNKVKLKPMGMTYGGGKASGKGYTKRVNRAKSL